MAKKIIGCKDEAEEVKPISRRKTRKPHAMKIPGFDDARIVNYRSIPAPRNASPFDQYVVSNVTGNSLKEVGIRKGDWVMARRSSEAKTDDLIVVKTPCDVTLGFYHPKPYGVTILKRGNKAYPELYYLSTELEIIGVVVTSGRDWTKGGM